MMKSRTRDFIMVYLALLMTPLPGYGAGRFFIERMA